MASTVFIGLLRGINVGGKKMLGMQVLRDICEAAGLAGAQTVLQSGNVVFRTSRADRKRLAGDIEKGIRERAVMEVRVILRTAAELEAAVERNPFPDAAESDPGHLAIVFLDDKPAAKAMAALKESYSGPEPMRLVGQDLYVHYVSGMGQSKLTNVLIERKLGVAATTRNWNTANRLLDLAGRMEE